MSAGVTITRIVNACVLFELDGAAVLTDPLFEARWFLRLREPVGLRPAELPPLTAILGGHGVFDHWQLGPLRDLAEKERIQVLVATAGMRRRAQTAGFSRAEVVEWESVRTVASRLTVEVVRAQSDLGLRTNSYVLNAGEMRIFIGTEARALEPLRAYRQSHPPVDVALLPIDGSEMLGRALVMGPEEALEAARILGARTLVPIHYALRPMWPLLRTPGSLASVSALARNAGGLNVRVLEPGRRWRINSAEPTLALG